EPVSPGRGTSSSMPHKHNPVACAVALAAGLRAPALVAVLFGAMPQEYQRGLGGWQAEWSTLPELFTIAADSMRHMSTAVGGLVVKAPRMRQNIEALQGLAMAEQATLALAPSLGRVLAHNVVEAASGKV